MNKTFGQTFYDELRRVKLLRDRDEELPEWSELGIAEQEDYNCAGRHLAELCVREIF